ncbi:membrane protein PM19L-like isoform X2 [Actinidia eriantha]|uniref:membrane protein PM19L-like isoform X2 n=1 Tax=Actinidia eriantha TaxID=165200 RepID=UPI002585CEB2|nr:membrane protein PM19L-like isoform X2 [Actinidia eriantha]
MAVGREGRSLIGPLLIANFVVYLILLGLAAWSLDKYIDGEQNHPHLGGNPATSFMLIFAMVGGVIGVCSVVAGLMHHRAWCSNSLVTAASSAIISWAVTSLALGLVCKEIIMGGYRGKRLACSAAGMDLLIIVVMALALLQHTIPLRRALLWLSKCRLSNDP